MARIGKRDFNKVSLPGIVFGNGRPVLNSKDKNRNIGLVLVLARENGQTVDDEGRRCF